MAVVPILNYVFDPGARTLEFTDYFSPGIEASQVNAVLNASIGKILVNPADPSLCIKQIVGNKLYFNDDLDLSDSSALDSLIILYDDPTIPQQVSMATRIAGEDLTNDWLRVIMQSNWTRVTTAATTVIKSSSARLIAVVCATPVASAVATIYDNTAGSGTILGAITLPGTLLSDGPKPCLIGGAKTNTGLTVVTTGTAEWWFFWQ